MQLTFLGTSAGKPTIERNVSALALEFDQDNKWYLFDCGEATQHQMIRSHLYMGKLDTIFITHLHGDHYYGLPGLLATKKIDAVLRPLNIYGPKGIKMFLECALDISPEHLGYVLKIIEFEANEMFVFDKFSLTVLPLVHSIESFAFYIKENDISDKLDVKKLRTMGMEPSPIYARLKKGMPFSFGGKKIDPKAFMLEPIMGRRVIIAGDNGSPAVLDKYLDELDLLVHECTYTQEVYDNLTVKVLHTTAKVLGTEIQEKSVKNLIVNHINPRYNKNNMLDIDLIYEEIKQSYKGKIFIANDFDVFRLGRDGMVERV